MGSVRFVVFFCCAQRVVMATDRPTCARTIRSCSIFLFRVESIFLSCFLSLAEGVSCCCGVVLSAFGFTYISCFLDGCLYDEINLCSVEDITASYRSLKTCQKILYI